MPRKPKKKAEVEVSANLYFGKWSFGLFPVDKSNKKIKLDYDLWRDFTKIREKYEDIYDKLKKIAEKDI